MGERGGGRESETLNIRIVYDICSVTIVQQ